MQIQAEFQPLNRATGSRVPIRVCSADDARVTAADGQRWWPAIVRRPALSMELSQGDFTGTINTGAGQMALSAYGVKRADANAPGYAWNAAPVKFWTIDPATGTRVLRFEGFVERITNAGEAISVELRVDTEPFVQNALTLTYAGTGGVEGPTDLANKIKPLLFGRCFNIEPVLINAVDNVYQISAYGPIHGVPALYERGSLFGASNGDSASYAALVAATINPGQWRTCLAEGLIRLGAPAYGVITADADGDKPGGIWLRRTGEIIERLCSIASVASGSIDSTSLAAIDTWALGLPNDGQIGLYLTDQVRLLDLVQQLARPLNAQAGVSWLGKLFITRTVIGTPAVVFDAQARRRPAVAQVSEQSVSPPYWRIEMQGNRSWRVHGDADIAQGFLPSDEVKYPDGTTVADLQPAAPSATRNEDGGGNLIVSPIDLLNFSSTESLIRRTPPGHSGATAPWMVVHDAGASGLGYLDNLAGFPGVPGERIWFRGRYFQNSLPSGSTLRMKAEFLDGAGAYIAGADIFFAQRTVGTDFPGFAETEVVDSFVFPAGAAGCRLSTNPNNTISGIGFSALLKPWAGRQEPAADVTAAAVPILVLPPTTIIRADHTGAVTAGQLPRDVQVRVFRGGVDVTSSTPLALAISPSGAASASIAGSGIVTITAMAGSAAQITVTPTLAGLAPASFALEKQNAPPPVSGSGGGGSASTSAISSFDGSSYVVVATLDVTTGSTGRIDLAAALDISTTSAGGAFNVLAKVQVNTGSWFDVGSEASAVGLITDGEPSSIYPGGTATGLSANTSYPVRLVMRTNTTGRTVTPAGTFSATGS